MKKSVSKTAGPIILGEKLSIRHIGELVGTLDVSLKSGSAAVVDASAVRSSDIAALQVLVAFANSARAQSLDVDWKFGDGELRKFMKLADLDRHLTVDVAPAVAENDGLCPVF